MLDREGADLFRGGLINPQEFPPLAPPSVWKPNTTVLPDWRYLTRLWAYTQPTTHDDTAMSREGKLYTKEDNTPA